MPQKTYEARLNYQRERSAKRNHLMARFKVFKGCAHCGYNEDARALQFHHRDGRNGSPQIGAMSTASKAALKCEFDKCDILCANCHAIITNKEF